MPSSALTILAYLWVIAAGAAVALQQVLNARLRTELSSPWWAGTASYVVGLLAMLAVVAVVREAPPPASAIRSVPPYLWLGGLLGAFFIATAILTVPRFGAATVLALIVVGQLLGSLAFDHFGLFGLTQQPATLIRLAGAVLLVTGAVLIRW